MNCILYACAALITTKHSCNNLRRGS